MSTSITSTPILDGINFNCVTDERFKTNRISVNLITELNKDTVTANAIVPFILKKGYNECPDFTAFNRKLENLYGAFVSSYVQKVGDYQILSLSITAIDDSFALDNEKVTKEIADILCNLVINPVLHDGKFLEKGIEIEKVVLIDAIEADINDKRIYAINNLIKDMCKNEPFGIPKHGYVDEVKKLTPEAITRAYDKLISSARIEIMFTGRNNAPSAEGVFCEAFSKLKREYRPLAPINMHKPNIEQNNNLERMSVSQSKMVLGFSNGLNSDSELVTATKLMVAVLGGTPSAKLFVNVREKLSLCYYCAARYDRFKGIMIIDSGVEAQNIQKANNEIIAQLECIKNNDFTDDEISNAILSLKNTLNSVYDSDLALESWYLGQILGRKIKSPLDEVSLLERVTREEIVAAAKEMQLDTIYILTGSEVE